MEQTYRNEGIDLLKLIAMFFVVVLHTLGGGGVLEAIDPSNDAYSKVWLLETLAYPGVDIFAIVSGYVCFLSNREIKKIYSKYIILWLEVVYYGVLFLLLALILSPSIISISVVANTIFPVTSNSYWYFSAYTGVIVISPIIITGVCELSNTASKIVLVICCVLFSGMNYCRDSLALANGYSFAWLLVLFVIGSIIAKLNDSIRKNRKRNLMLFVFLYIITWVSYIKQDSIYYKLSFPYTNSLLSYTSPSVLIISILWAIFFSELTINRVVLEAVRYLTPGAFAVYIVNSNVIAAKLYENKLAFISEWKPSIIILSVILFSFLYLISVAWIDKFRQFLFKKLNIKTVVENIIHF